MTKIKEHLKGYTIDDLKGKPVSNQSKNLTTLGKSYNRDPNEINMRKLSKAIEEFNFLIPVKYDGNIKDVEKALMEGVSFPLIYPEYESVKGKSFLPVFTCLGEMIETLYKLKMLSDFDKIIEADVGTIYWIMSDINAIGYVIDVGSLEIYNYNPDKI